MSLLYRNWLIMNSLLKALYDISTIFFCVLLWGKAANAAVICDFDFFRHPNILVLPWQSGWQVWIKRGTLICCRNWMKMCASRDDCVAGKWTPSDHHSAGEMPHWRNYLLLLLTTGWPQYRERFWLDCFTSSLVVKWWLLTYTVMLITQECSKQLSVLMSFSVLYMFTSGDRDKLRLISQRTRNKFGM